MSQGHNKQSSNTEQSVEMTVNDFEIDDIIDFVNKLDSTDVNDEINEFEVIAQTEMQNIYKDEIEKIKQIIKNSNINGETILSYCNNQQELEQYLTNTFGDVWVTKHIKHCSNIATSILKSIDKIRNYTIDQMIQFIAYFDISLILKAISDANWDENKFKNSNKKQWNDSMASYNIPRGISIKIWKAINAKVGGNQSRASKRVIFDEVENKYSNAAQEEQKNNKLAGIVDPNNQANISNDTVIFHSATPEPPSSNTIVNFSDWKFDKQELKLPTYIAKALYYLSEDDILELLTDRAVSKVLSFDELWRDQIFCNELYNDDTFHKAVDKIYKCVHDEETEYDFINDFVEKELKREIANYQKGVYKNKKDKNSEDIYENKYDEDDNQRQLGLEVQLSCSNMEIKSKCISEGIYKITVLEEGFDPTYEWALFRRKTLRNVYMQNMRTSGYWKILTPDPNDFDEQELVPITKQNSFEMEEKDKETGGIKFYTTELDHSLAEQIEDTGPITRDLVDLNAILMFLQTMDTEHLTTLDKDKIKFIPQDLKLDLKPVIRLEFDVLEDDMYEKQEEKMIDDDDTAALKANKKKNNCEKVTKKWYEIYWWNMCKEDNKVHALALKNHASKGKMEYYLRYVMGQNPNEQENTRSRSRMSRSTTKSIQQQTTDNNILNSEQPILEWIWFDNDTANYKRYDLGNNVLKQLEASFHSNCSHIFPKQLNCNFNYLLLKEMTNRLKGRGKNVGLGYVLRFAYSNSDRAKIVNMEQLSVWKNAPEYARSVQRMINGRNSIFMYFSSSNSEYYDEWKKVYQLYTENQQKYFWAHVLAVATAVHYISTEIRNQVITFNYSEQTRQQDKNLVFQNLNDLEIQKEQKSYKEYPGFLITPQQFIQTTADEKQENMHHNAMGGTNTFQSNLYARAVVLQKFNTNVNYDKRSGDLPKQHCPHAEKRKWRNAQQQFYCDECASLLQYAEFVRKFILEYENPEVKNFLWPWYRNTFHHNDFIKYHSYIDRYNLTTLYTQSDILQIQNQLLRPELQFDGCFKRMKNNFEVCTQHIRTCSCCHPRDAELPRPEENIRYRRKFAARFLLGGWNISRNLNIIRQQLKIIFTQLDKENNEAQQRLLIQNELAVFFQQDEEKKDHIDNDNDNKSTRRLRTRSRAFSRIDSKVTMHRRKITENETESKLWMNEISEVNKNIPEHYHYECPSMEFKTPSQLAYFSKFIRYCLKSADSIMQNCNQSKNNQNKNKKHRKTTDYENYYSNFLDSWLRTPKFYTIEHDIILFRLALKYNLNEKEFISELNGMNSNDYQQLLSSSQYYDCDRPFHEFSSWCQRWENIFHRLRYLTHCIVLILSKCTPSIIDCRIPSETDRSFTTDTELNSIIFLDSIMYQTHLKYCRDEKDSISRDRDNDFNNNNRFNILPIARKRDPFIVRRLEFEFKEILYSFDLYKHGKIMGQFLIDRLEMKQRKSLWILLGTLLKRMPYHMSLQLLTKNRDLLRRGEPSLFDSACDQVLDGCHFSVPVALYLSSLMEVCAEEDLARHSQWISYSKKYEQYASSKINTVESDHIISILLDARIFMDEEGLLEMALESRRLHFLNSETINGVISHMYQTVDFSNPHSNPSFKPATPLDNWQLFQFLLIKPFFLHLSPIGFSWTIGVLFVIYCIMIAIYLSLGIHQIDIFPDIESWQGIFEIVIWSCSGGYLANDIWDMALSIQFIILFIFQIINHKKHMIFFGQSNVYFTFISNINVYSIRALRLFRTSTFLSPLLHVVGLMVETLVKFLIVIIATCIHQMVIYQMTQCINF